MEKLMEAHFVVNKGQFFDHKHVVGGSNVYLSELITDGFWNYVLVSKGKLSKRKVGKFDDFFQSVDRLTSVYLLGDDKYNKEFVEENGFSLISEETFMTYEVQVENNAQTSSLNVLRVETPESINDFLEVFTSAYGGEKTEEQPYGELDETYILSVRRSFAYKSKFYHFVCYDSEKPVSIATLCFENGYGGIYSVGTNPEFRGKGFGTVATNACISKWHELGGKTLFLQTETGSAVEKWYFKLGFKKVFIGNIYSKG